MESFFQSTLTDLVKVMRSTNLSEAAFLDAALIECKREIRSTDPHIKATALQKVTYISMLQGADMSWASFHCLEVMSQARFWHKQAGYLAMTNSFTGHSDLLLLATNLFRKDLASSIEYEAAQALNALSRVLTPSLARDLLPDVCQALSSSRLAVRKRAVLVLHHFFRADANAAPQTALKPLVAKLKDSETAVVCCAVNVLCELVCSSATPSVYLPLAPPLFALLTQSTNTWLVIKLVKLFGVLAPLEPRLAAKLAAPLTAIICSTPAKSLAYECVRTATVALSDDTDVMALCTDKLRDFIQDQDPNLRYLGLLALARLLPAHTAAVAPHRATALACLTDADPTIQQVALRLVRGLVETADDANDVTDAMLRLLREGTLDSDFQHQLVATLLELNSRDHYALVADFTWYAGVLVTLAQVSGSPHGGAVAAQLIDIALRVPDARPDLVHHVRDLLLAPALLLGGPAHPTVAAALGAAAWITGEYASHVQEARPVVEALLQPNVTLLPSDVQAVYVQAILKVLVNALVVHPTGPDAFVGASSPTQTSLSPQTPKSREVSTSHEQNTGAFTFLEPKVVPSKPPATNTEPSTPPERKADPSSPSKPERVPASSTRGYSDPLPASSASAESSGRQSASADLAASSNLHLLDTTPPATTPVSPHPGAVSRQADVGDAGTTPSLQAVEHVPPTESALPFASSGQDPSSFSASVSNPHFLDTLPSAAATVEGASENASESAQKNALENESPSESALRTSSGLETKRAVELISGFDGALETISGLGDALETSRGMDTKTALKPKNVQTAASLITLVRTHLDPLLESRHIKVQNRAVTLLALLELLPTGSGDRALRLLAATSAEELQPVAAHAQSLVVAPEGLCLETSLEALAGLVPHTEPSEWGPEARAREDAAASGDRAAGFERVDAAAALEEARAAREAHRQRHGQYYLPSDESRPLDTGHVDTDAAVAPVPAPVARRKPARAVVKLDEELPPGMTRWMSGEGLQSGGNLKGGVLEQNVAGLLAGKEDPVSAAYSQEEKVRQHRSKAREGRRKKHIVGVEPQSEEVGKGGSKSGRHQRVWKKRPPAGAEQVDQQVVPTS